MTALPKEVAEYFPYPTVRPHQDEFIKTIYDAVKQRRAVLIEGSNGLGKTVSALSACLSTALDNGLKIMYVARTHRQHDRVIDELKAICRKKLVPGVSLRGRNEMCLNELAYRRTFDAKSLMEVCELLKSKDKCPFYINMEENTEDFLQVQQQITSHPCKASDIQKICRKKAICPYELIKASLSDFNVIALSYLYIFDSAIRASFIKNSDAQFDKIILIVDEAHNLPDTAIEIASRSLSLSTIKQAELEARKLENKQIEAFLNLLRTHFEASTANIKKEELFPPEVLIDVIKQHGAITNPREFFEHMHEVGTFVKRSLLAEGKSPRSYIHGVSEFLLKWLETVGDDSFINVASTYMTRDKTPTAKLEIVALDPSKVTAPVFASTYSTVIMSGTLQPLDAYARITKIPDNALRHIAPSPFPKEHVLALVCLGLTTAMEKRTPEMYQTIIKRIAEVADSTPANTGVFTASFDVLNALVTEGIEDALSKPLFRERRGMNSKANEKLVAEFKSYAKRGGAVFLGVQGGRTSEGVDFPGDQMNAVVIVGVPYAEPTPRVKAQIDYYEKCFPKLGREYGYILPAMKKASQAAGRPIRTLEDRGAIVFMDYRFATAYCRRFLPAWITREMRILHDYDGLLSQEIRGFFKKAY
ncbi:MAG: ATP-dependent DNA helicase [Candidatus Bathyarchaeia archaeon]